MMVEKQTKETVIDQVLCDLLFKIESTSHRAELKEILGGEKEIRALEDFLREREYEEGQFFEDVQDMY